MELSEPRAHSFVVRIWREGGDSAADKVTWRGHISHVPSGRRRYIKDLAEIAAFIKPYLAEMGVPVNFRGRIQRWLGGWQKRLRLS